jgi:hypothetical protein
MNLTRYLLSAALFFTVLVSSARPLAPQEVPEPLKPWIDWVMHDNPQRLCPFLYNNQNTRRCAWPSELTLVLNEQRGEFEQKWTVYAPSWIPLPGGSKHWPQSVTANGKPLPVLPRSQRPAIELLPGNYKIKGSFEWDNMPESFPIPPDTGLVRLTVNDMLVEFPDVNANGRLWLKQRNTGEEVLTETDTLNVQVYRKLIDDNPLQVVTQIDLKVGGKQREVIFDSALLENLIPLALNSPLPAQVEPGGAVRIQIRPGHWKVNLTARAVGEQLALAPTAGEPPWPEEEIWVFQAQPQLRLVEVNGVTSIDPRQTTLPTDWSALPAYRVKPGENFTLKVIRRGDPEPEPDQLQLARQLWLDFDGGGYTVNDVISGSMTQGWRLETHDDLALGRVLLNGQPQLITTQDDTGKRGIEVRHGGLHLVADSRWDENVRRLPAVGWDHDFHRLSTTLNLPPGWTLFSTKGIDNVRDTWLQQWTLLDLFLVLISALAVGRLWDRRWGMVALATFTITWHESGAPHLIWLHILAAVALLRVLPTGKLEFLVKSYRNVSLLVLLTLAVPYVIDEVRTGLYPQLEYRGHAIRSMTDSIQGFLGSPQNKAEQTRRNTTLEEVIVTAEKAPESLLDRALSVEDNFGEYDAGISAPLDRNYSAYSSLRKRKLAAIDPSANVQTGPGVPHWQWRRVNLKWNSPVEQGQEMILRLMSPRLNLFLDIVRVLLVAALGVMLLLTVRPGRLGGSAGSAGSAGSGGSAQSAMAIVSLALLLPLMSLSSTDAQATEFPDQTLLQQLRTRLLAPPDCLPACAEVARLTVQADPTILMLRMEVLAAEAVAIPLPAHPRHWLPDVVSLDGQVAENLYRQQQQLWILIPAGRHQVLLSGSLPARNSIDLPLPLKPRFVEVTANGWQVDGVHDDGIADSQLLLTRMQTTTADTDAPIHTGEKGTSELNTSELESAPLPPFVRVQRTLSLGLEWHVHTTVVRASPRGVAAVIEVALLAGESVTTANIHVEAGKVQVNIPAGGRAMSWDSVLEVQPSLTLTAPSETSWTEVWQADISPIWHAVPSGIAVVHHQDPGGQWLPQWRPWPGEQVRLAITRPAGVDGQTLTIDQSNLVMRPGKRATDLTLGLSLRSSQGGQHTITLPEHARVQSVHIDGAAQPIRQEERSVTLPLHPGKQQVNLAWRHNEGISTRLASPQVDLGVPSVNSSINIKVARDRWVLLTGGPRLGPAVLFWGVLIVLAVVAVGLGRVSLTPLNSTAWLLLAVGLSQTTIVLAMVIVGWLFALGLRARLPSDTRDRIFNLAQIGLVLLTGASLIILFQAIQHGLLGAPDMQIAGNGSNAYDLYWYQDRVDAQLPDAWALSVPLMAYRVLMLGWALWLASALLKWLRWGWDCFATDGLWRPVTVFKRKSPDSSPAT